jgi:hypothetical protein
MKIKLEMDVTPEEFQELFVPGDKQEEFLHKTYDAYTRALTESFWRQVDPYSFVKPKK